MIGKGESGVYNGQKYSLEELTALGSYQAIVRTRVFTID